jgi:TRAP-type transport system small permease protein
LKAARLYHPFHKAADIFYRSCFYAGAFFAIAMTLIVIINIFSRYFLNYAISWAEEISRYLMVWMVMLGAAMGVRLGTHFRMEMIENFVGRGGKTIFHWFTLAVFSAVGFVLLWHGMILLPLTDYQYATATQIPMSWVYVSLPLSGFLMIFFVVDRFLKSNGQGTREE